MVSEYKSRKLHLLRQVKVESGEDARKRSVISRINTSTYFTELYSALFGGRTNKKRIRDILEDKILAQSVPDIIARGDEMTDYTEVKVCSVKTSGIKIPQKQIENYCYLYLFESSRVFGEGKGRLPFLDYALFRYGNNWRTKGLHMLSNKSLVERLSSEKTELTILPLNLILSLLPLSKSELFDQSSSDSSLDYQQVYSIPGSILSQLHGGHGLENFLFEEGFYLSELKSRSFMSEPIVVNYYGNKVVNPFSVTRYYMSLEKEDKWRMYFLKNHFQILSHLGLEDRFETYDYMENCNSIKNFSLESEPEADDYNEDEVDDRIVKEYYRSIAKLDDDIPF